MSDYYHRDYNYNSKRGGRRQNSGRNSTERYNVVSQIKEATGNYYSNNEIIHHLKEVNDDMERCIQVLIEKRQNSWSNVVAPTKLVITNPRTGNNENNNDSNNEKETKSETKKETKRDENKNNNKRENTRTNTSNENKNENTRTNTSNENKNDTKSETSQVKKNSDQSTNTKQTKSGGNQNGQSGSNANQNTSNNTNQSPPQQQEIKPTDFDFIERSLAEKQIQINREAEMLSTLLTDIKNLKENKNSKLTILNKEREQLEEKKRHIHEEYNKVLSQLKDKEEIIKNFENDFNNEYLRLKKNVESYNQSNN
jgi:hypothetical protein